MEPPPSGDEQPGAPDDVSPPPPVEPPTAEPPTAEPPTSEAPPSPEPTPEPGPAGWAAPAPPHEPPATLAPHTTESSSPPPPPPPVEPPAAAPPVDPLALPSDDAPVAIPAPPSVAPLPPPPPPPVRGGARRGTVAVLGAIVVLLVGAVAFLALTGDDDDDRASSDRIDLPGRGDRDDGDADEPQDYGDDPRLDALWDDCEEGDIAACDELYNESGVGTAYEEFGDTCGERNEPQGYCVDIYGDNSFGDIEDDPSTGFASDDDPPGEDATLDDLWVECGTGAFAACDELYRDSDFGSEYEDFARTCGGRNQPAGFCEEIYGSR